MTKLLFILIIVALTLVSLTLPSKNISPFTFYFLKKFTLILIIINTGVLQFLNTLYIQPIGLGKGNNILSTHFIIILNILSLLNSLAFLNIQTYSKLLIIINTLGFITYLISFTMSIGFHNIINFPKLIGFHKLKDFPKLIGFPNIKGFLNKSYFIGFLKILTYFILSYLIGFPLYNNFTSKDLIKILQFILALAILSFELILRLSLLIFKLLISLSKKSSLHISNYLDKDKIPLIQLLSIEYSKRTKQNDPRLVVFTFKINYDLSLDDSMKCIFSELLKRPEFLDFGENKIIITQAIISNGALMLHRNVLIDNDTTVEELYLQIKGDLAKFAATNYHNHYEFMSVFRVRVWDVDLYENLKIKRTLSTIFISKRYYSTYNGSKGFNLNTKLYITPKPLPKVNKTIIQHPYDKLKPIATLDIETITFKGLQLPIYISLTFNNTEHFYFKQTISFMINKTNFDTDPNKTVIDMFKELFKFIELNLHPKTIIFVHNLGAFDGYFIFKYATIIYDVDTVKSIIDPQNKFILISIKHIVFKDSFRIFSISLNSLCDVFNNGVGKTSAYNPNFNTIEVLTNQTLKKEFIKYADNDSLVLYNCMLNATILYKDKYDVDLSKTVSMSSLSMVIFRSKFLTIDIPVLTNKLDEFVRDSYYGGATAYYIKHAVFVYYYDVNSLYPFAMMKDLPLKPLRWVDNSVKLEDFFGFALVKVYCPVTIKKPILPFRYKNKTIFPTGSWVGVYYSEELKAVSKYGYKIEIIKGVEFSKANIFGDYIKHFYDIKKNSVGALRFIGKNHLNYLYGLFGRSKVTLETITILNKDIEFYLISRVIKNMIEIDDEKTVLLSLQNVDNDIIKKLNSTIETDLKNFESDIKTNVAIASAVTANARIHMIDFKMSDNTCYTDTDSIFTTEPLPEHLVSDE